jgi:hypothetical protein
MSLCTMRALCAASRASATSMASGRRLSISRGRPAMRCLRVTPSRNSIAMKASPVLLANVVNRTNVCVVQSGSGLRLPYPQPCRQCHTAAAHLFDDAIVWELLGLKTERSGNFIWPLHEQQDCFFLFFLIFLNIHCLSSQVEICIPC